MNLLDPQWLVGGFVALLALIGAFFGIKSSGKKEGVQQERNRQQEQMAQARETVVSNTTTARKSTDKELDERLSKWQRK